MNKENYYKSKISLWTGILEDMEKIDDEDEYRLDCIERTKKDIKAFNTYLKLLSLPTRTIDTLEVGKDIVIYKDLDGKIRSSIPKNSEELSVFKMMKANENDSYLFGIILIIPHEAIELLKGLVE